jgi:hypothetical protein
MMEAFLNWMYTPNTWNDVIVYLAVFFIVSILVMIFKDSK